MTRFDATGPVPIREAQVKSSSLPLCVIRNPDVLYHDVISVAINLLLSDSIRIRIASTS